MVDTEYKLSKDEQREVLKRRKVFSSAEGIKVLAEIVVSAGVFSKIDTEDREANAIRNFAIDVMDSMFMVQTGSVEMLLQNMLTTPLPVEKEEKSGDNPV